MSENNGNHKERKKVRASHVIFISLAVIACISLAYWQWTRFQAGSGTFQNLGYALQWPMFGAFVVIAYRLWMKYENEMIDAQNESEDPNALYEADKLIFEEKSTEIDEEFLPERPRIDVDTFNKLNTPRRHRHDSDDAVSAGGTNESNR
ncbi:hypothetical protein [Corynebacterium halotolerans]|uniref:hypothetical protein n=1 Tax=Corynebacterium halotolerans TaxID=225326 RepID=UPI003CF1CA7D